MGRENTWQFPEKVKYMNRVEKKTPSICLSFSHLSLLFFNCSSFSFSCSLKRRLTLFTLYSCTPHSLISCSAPISLVVGAGYVISLKRQISVDSVWSPFCCCSSERKQACPSNLITLAIIAEFRISVPAFLFQCTGYK